jgi:hypothetical protein
MNSTIFVASKTSIMNKILLLILILSAGTLLSTESCKGTSTYYDATVIFSGDEATGDGCGFLLAIDGTTFYANGIKDEFKVDGAKLKIQYQVSALPHTCPDGTNYTIASITRYL